MEPEISDKELETFLKSAGVAIPLLKTEESLSNAAMADTPHFLTHGVSSGADPLDMLLDEMIERTQKNDSCSIQNPERGFDLYGTDKKRKRLKLTPLWLTMSFLGTFFLGSVLGYYWGNHPQIKPTLPPLEKIEEQLNQIENEMRQLAEKTSPLIPPAMERFHEIIEPVEAPKELDPTIPEALR